MEYHPLFDIRLINLQPMTQIIQLPSRSLVKKGVTMLAQCSFITKVLALASSFPSTGSVVPFTGAGLHTVPLSAFLLGTSARSWLSQSGD